MLTIVFDLDGTLVDTAPDLIDTLNLTLAQRGLSVVPFETARPLIGGGARGMIEHALATEGRDCAPADVDRLYEAFVAHYAEHIADRSRAVPAPRSGARPAGRPGLSARGMHQQARMAVEAPPRGAASDAALRRDLRPGHFRRAEARSEDVSATVERAGGEPKRAIMVGDSVTDIRTARAAGVPVIAVDFGYTDVPIASLRPDRVISSFAELPAAIDDLGQVKNIMDDQDFIGHKG